MSNPPIFKTSLTINHLIDFKVTFFHQKSVPHSEWPTQECDFGRARTHWRVFTDSDASAAYVQFCVSINTIITRYAFRAYFWHCVKNDVEKWNCQSDGRDFKGLFGPLGPFCDIVWSPLLWWNRQNLQRMVSKSAWISMDG